jgi:hypothetical protein
MSSLIVVTGGSEEVVESELEFVKMREVSSISESGKPLKPFAISKLAIPFGY